jgi:hypothetical protein
VLLNEFLLPHIRDARLVGHESRHSSHYLIAELLIASFELHGGFDYVQPLVCVFHTCVQIGLSGPKLDDDSITVYRVVRTSA